MFEHYVFGASSPTVIEDSFPSPRDCSSLPPFSSPTSLEVDDCMEEEEGLGNIISQLSTSLLQPDEHPQASSLWSPTAPSFTSEELTYTSLRRGKVNLHDRKRARESSEERDRRGLCKRKQRMRDTKMLSCADHKKDIEGLVKTMISTSSQCNIVPSPTSTSQPTSHIPTSTSPLEIDPFESTPLELDTPSLEAEDDFPAPPSLQIEMHEDEGFVDSPSSPDADIEMTLRRASMPMGVRKWNMMRYRAGGELAGAGLEAYGAGGAYGEGWVRGEMVNARKKVRCVPRMRRRRKIEDRQSAQAN